MKLKNKDNCSIFLTAGYPKLESALELVPELENAGVDLIELGIPFSDPLADGSVIQGASTVAINNGMNIDLLFEQVAILKSKTSIPIILMGYFNPVFNFGLVAFLEKCQRLKIDGLILPDLPVEVYENEYIDVFDRYNVPLVFLITPTSSEKRIRQIESHSKAFIYLVSSGAITGKRNAFSIEQIQGFERIAKMKLSVPVLTGFGIYNHETFRTVCRYTNGAIIGSAFIRSLEENRPVKTFVNSLLCEAEIRDS